MRSIDDARVFAESVLNTTHDPLIVLDKDLKVVSANPAFYRHFRVKRQDTEGVRIFELGNGQWDIPDLRKLLGEIIPINGQVENYQVEHNFPEIGPRIMLLQARRINQEGGRRSLILLDIQDVTEECTTRRALEESEARYNRLVEEINSLILEVDSDGIITFFNSFAEKVFGYQRNEVIGKKLAGTILPNIDSNGTDNSQLIPRVLRDPDRFYLNESLGNRKNGEEVWFSWSARSMRNPETQENSILIDGNDLTYVRNARRQAREALEIIHASETPVLRLDNQNKCRLVNRAFANLVRKDIEEIEGSHLKKTGLSDQLIGQLESAITKARQRRKFQIMETHYAGNDLEVRIEPEYEPDSDFSGVIVYFHNVTRRKQAEDERRKLNETLEERVAERTSQLRALAAMLTRTEEEQRHELAQVIHDQLQQLLVAAKMRVAQEARKAQDERQAGALREVEELLGQSIDESRSVTAELSPPILYQEGLEAGLRWLVRRMRERHGLKVELQVSGKLNEISDRTLSAFLFRAIHELLFNVVKHAGADRASVEVVSDSEQVRIVVSDLGRGYDPSDNVKTVSGFGLFSIRERLTFMGGRLQIQTAPGKGTRTTVEIPLQREQTVEQMKSSVRDISASLNVVHTEPFPKSAEGRVPIRVLLVDDHRIVRDGFSRILSEQPGIEVVGQAEDGLAALEMARSLRPDLIIMDVTMPRMDGVEATRRLKSELPWVKVIGLSMHMERDMAEAMGNAGAEAYLNKGGPADTLIETIRTCASGS